MDDIGLLTQVLNYRVETLMTTYLGVPLGTSKKNHALESGSSEGQEETSRASKQIFIKGREGSAY